MVKTSIHDTNQCYKVVNGVAIFKRKHNTDKEAIEEAKRLNQKENIFHKVVAYKCFICGMYHVGKSKKYLK